MKSKQLNNKFKLEKFTVAKLNYLTNLIGGKNDGSGNDGGDDGGGATKPNAPKSEPKTLSITR